MAQRNDALRAEFIAEFMGEVELSDELSLDEVLEEFDARNRAWVRKGEMPESDADIQLDDAKAWLFDRVR